MPIPEEEFDIYITPDGEEYLLHNETIRWIRGGLGGLGMPPIEYHTTRGPYQHGDTVEDFRLRPRIIQMVPYMVGESRENYWTLRQEFIAAIRPNRSLARTPAQLRKILPDGSVRDIDVYVMEGPAFGITDPEQWQEWSPSDIVRFLAPTPTFYDPTQQLFNAVMAVELELVFPIDPFILFGPMTNSLVVSNITVPGTWETFPVIELVGPMTNPKIENITIDEAIQLEYEILGGRTVTIDLAPRLKTIQDDLGNNLLAYITTDSDLVTFRLEVDPIAPNGINVVEFSAGGLDLNQSQFNLRWYNRWLGL